MRFDDFPKLVKKLVLNILRSPQSHFAIIQLFEDDSAKLDFIQNLEYKYIGRTCLGGDSGSSGLMRRFALFVAFDVE